MPSGLSPAEQRLYSVASASQILNIGRSHAYDEIRLGRLRTVRSGRRRLVPIEYIEEYVELLKSEADDMAA
ncbi:MULTISPECIES: helix-turn-helix domain-containing protein [Streptomyces]|uniref:Helix-turn-helix domain-containing protein n=1 Tax=Streptomyces griseocarneus TaxID=51201 RepID=A0ABX7RQU5_9ACTN|nr:MULTISPECIES: helix-turn-helix domain-containing protein [Streptomyces]QSY50182.1 helix-turn-helix domain-containing protein [Streptomyces griseocarneus]